ncbi:TPR repeat-containing adenylate/guanylate cyclase [Reticulomyxa filosa]|uniref:TPR repeat-containing adenylate/guanylate cyclase n=1 Tax=Reticulomyxa filosa TaxID=46433 RepID=X6LZW7_RETFI|nr:TPR repeat-containing adenylate/guanylate cyclase [Reticulomyxa filosa]|eukprot:ETO06285.1 TPR repeat-containing adenylate/guanylate cyclase [Reticulomyxa filosa]
MTTPLPKLQKLTSAPLAQEAEQVITEVYAQALTSFVPEIVKHALQREEKINAPYCETFYSAALFADVSGFTAMSKMLAAKGTRGTEELPQHINSYLGQIGITLAQICFCDIYLFPLKK